MRTSQSILHNNLSNAGHKSYISIWLGLCLLLISLPTSAQNAIEIGDGITYEFSNSWFYSAKGDSTDNEDRIFQPTKQQQLIYPYAPLYKSTPDSVYSSFTLTALNSSTYGRVFRLHINQPCCTLNRYGIPLDSILQIIMEHDVILAYSSLLDQYIICNMHDFYPSLDKILQHGIPNEFLLQTEDYKLSQPSLNMVSLNVLKYAINAFCPGLSLAIMAQSIPWQDKVTITGKPLDGSSRTMNYCNTTDKVKNGNNKIFRSNK